MNTNFTQFAKRFLVSAFGSFFAVAFIFGSAALSVNAAATFTVTRNDDVNICSVGDCSLRGAVNAANLAAGADEINFSSSLNGATITVGSEISIAQSLTINGLGANLLSVSGGNTTRIFSIADNQTVTMRDFTLENANTPFDGGAIRGQTGINLTIERMYFNNNVATGFYGGILLNNTATLNIKDSTFNNNRARICGAIGLSGTANIFNSTFSANQATEAGQSFAGAVCNFSFTMLIRNSTFTQNIGAGTNGGALWSSGTLNIGNTIIAANTGSASCPDICRNGSTIVSAGFNLVGNNSSATAVFPAGNPNANNDRVGASGSALNPQLGGLQINGGSTPTHALSSGSPAIDTGSNSLATAAGLTMDQRGRTRIFDGDVNGTAVVDIGAFEVSSAPTAATVAVSGRVQSGKRGVSGAIVYLTNASGETRTARTNSLGYYRFEDVSSGQTYVFNVFAKRFGFQPQVVTVSEEVTDLDFTTEQ